MQNTVYPEFCGPLPKIDGTLRSATFTHRYIFTLCLFCFLVLSSAHRAFDGTNQKTLALGIIFVVVDVIYLWVLYERDKNMMNLKLQQESDLPGSVPKWIPKQTETTP